MWYNVKKSSSRVTTFLLKKTQSKLVCESYEPKKLQDSKQIFNSVDVTLIVGHKICCWKGGGGSFLSSSFGVFLLTLACACTILVPTCNNHPFFWFCKLNLLSILAFEFFLISSQSSQTMFLSWELRKMLWGLHPIRK